MKVNKRAHNFKDITGQKFGRWTVTAFAGTRTKPSKGSFPAMWTVKCDCGTESVVEGGQLRIGTTTSCGCFQKEIASKQGASMIRESHPNWKGGRIENKKGYVQISEGLQHELYPEAITQPRRTFEHIAVMSNHLKRRLFKNETVHHKNGIKNDNRLENLELRIGNHGPGSSIKEIVGWAELILRRYAPEKLLNNQGQNDAH